MLSQFLFPVCLVQALTLSATAQPPQPPDPVPVRLMAETYGHASGVPGTLAIAFDLGGAAGPVVRVDGATPGAPALMLFAADSASIPVPGVGLLLVRPDAVVLAGTFDAAGRLELPIDVARQEWIDGSIYMQVAQLRFDQALQVGLTAGLSLRFAAGNAQPPLTYAGPPLTATLAQLGDNSEPYGYALLTTIVTPTSGWVLRLDALQSTQDVTILQLGLEAPGPEELVAQVLTTHRSFQSFGLDVAPRIEIWVRRTTRGDPTQPQPELAAVIERDW